MHQATPRAAELSAAIADIGAGPYLFIVVVLGGGLALVEGAVLLLGTVVARALSAKWSLSHLIYYMLGGSVLVGVFGGTIIGGVICDRWGRRRPLLLAYVGIVLGIVLAVSSHNVWVLIVAQLMLGTFLGFGVPAANALVCESCPPVQRTNIFCVSMILFSVGQMWAATILWIFSPSLHHTEIEWRLLMLFSATMPLTLFCFACLYLKESPHWLYANGYVEEAQEVLDLMAWYQKKTSSERRESKRHANLTAYGSARLSAPVLDSHERQGRRAGIARVTGKEGGDVWRINLLFHPRFRSTTITMCGITFVSNFAYFGMVYGLPHTMAEQAFDKYAWSPAAIVFFSSTFEIPGVVLAMLLGVTISRRLTMMVAFAAGFVCLWGVVIGLATGTLRTLGIMFVFGAKAFISSAFVIVYLYIIEFYPTNIRATGLSFCMVLGRIGSAVVPFTYDGFVFLKASRMWFFGISAMSMGCAALATTYLRYETKDADLEGSTSEDNAESPRSSGSPRSSRSSA